jgi:Ca2+-binding RTX toxin-like protein
MDFGTDGDDIINSNSDANILNGGLGNDELYGNDGSDTYVFTRGDGVDTIEDNGYLDNDRLVLHGYTPAEVLVQRATGGSGFDDLLLTFAGTTDAITIWNTLEDSSLDAIEEIVFDDGTIWTMADLRARIISESQTAGDDVVNGFWYDETLEGGLGNDELYGNDGSDTYVFTRGDGVDTIEDNGYLDNDRLVLHGYTPAEVLVQRATGGSGFDDLLLTFVGTTDAITIGNTLDGDYFDQIEQIVFDDGTVWTMADVDARFVDGTSGADSLVGGVNGDSLDGGAGDDALSGGAGNDLLIGGIGADALDGGDGIDRVSYRNADAGVYVHMGDVAQNTGEAAGDSYVSIEELEGTEFDDTLMGPIGGGSVFGLGGNDAIVGLGGGPNQLFGGDGNDSIYGDAFDDFIEGGAGDDIAFGYEGNDTIDVGPGNDYVVAGTGNDTVTGGLGDDEIHAGEGDDVLVGGDGADLLFGNFGNDVIDPGSGNDFILGGPGDDTFVFRPGLGNNRIDDFAAGAAAGDVIELQGLGVSTFADLQNLMAEWGGTTFIEFDADNSIILGGVSMASLTADDFRFVA